MRNFAYLKWRFLEFLVNKYERERKENIFVGTV
jgi:hypothetical protein